MAYVVRCALRPTRRCPAALSVTREPLPPDPLGARPDARLGDGLARFARTGEVCASPVRATGKRRASYLYRGEGRGVSP